MLLERLKELPFDNKPLKSLIDERVDIYDELGKLNPDNTSYQDLYKTSSEEKRLENRGAGVSILWNCFKNEKNINEAAYQDKLRYREKMSTSLWKKLQKQSRWIIILPLDSYINSNHI